MLSRLSHERKGEGKSFELSSKAENRKVHQKMKGLKDKRLRFDKQFEDYNCKTNGEIKNLRKN